MQSVIKAGEAPSLRSKMGSMGFVDHVAEAKSVLEQAHARAAEIIARAERETNEESHRVFARARELGHKVGYKKGLEEGLVAGQEQGRQESLQRHEQENAQLAEQMGRAVDAVDQVVMQIESVRNDLQHQAEENLLEFAIRLASKLTFAIGSLHRQAITENFNRCLALVGSKVDLHIKVNPDDLEFVRTYAPSATGRIEGSPHLQVVADESLTPGGCVVETAHGQVDASLETQVAEMVDLLLRTGADHD